MPSAGLLPTPGPSAELNGKIRASRPHADATFNLPPPAFNDPVTSATPNDKQMEHASNNEVLTQVSPAPAPSASRVLSRKRTASQAASNPEQFSLPPPPSRSRKIIQMRPGESGTKDAAEKAQEVLPAATNGKSSGRAKGKKKSASGSSAGRKVARKTAHSLIERRRRSKMNEEYQTLKEMIPACMGQEMHKLAILQASIEYMRYLEKCLADVKSEKQQVPTHGRASAHPQQPQRPGNRRSDPSANLTEGELEQMASSPRWRGSSRSSIHGSAPVSSLMSPAMSAVDTSPTISVNTHQYTFSRNATCNLELPSPASTRATNEHQSAPQSSVSTVYSSRCHSNQTSPTMLPLSSHSSAPSELDQEASAALLMLNASGSRSNVFKGTSDSSGQSQSRLRGISVKDLLRS